MSRTIVAMELKVQCADGCKHENVTLAVEDNRRIYLDADGNELAGVECIEECVAVLPPMVLAAVLSHSKKD